MSTGSQNSLFNNLKPNLTEIRVEPDREGMEVFVLPFSQMYAVFILWPVPAENCIYLTKKKLWMHLDGTDHNCPYGLHSPKSNQNTDILLKGVILSGLQLESYKEAQSADKQGQQEDILKCSRQTNSAKPRIGKYS